MSTHQTSSRVSRRRHGQPAAIHHGATSTLPDPFAPTAAAQRARPQRPRSAASTSSASTLAHDARSVFNPGTNQQPQRYNPQSSPQPTTSLDPGYRQYQPPPARHYHEPQAQSPSQSHLPQSFPSHHLSQSTSRFPTTQTPIPTFPTLHARIADYEPDSHHLLSSPHMDHTATTDPFLTYPTQSSHQRATPELRDEHNYDLVPGDDEQQQQHEDEEDNDDEARVGAGRQADARLLSIARSFFAHQSVTGVQPSEPRESQSLSQSQSNARDGTAIASRNIGASAGSTQVQARVVRTERAARAQDAGRASARETRHADAGVPGLAAGVNDEHADDDDDGDVEDGRFEDVRLEIMARLREVVGEKLEGERWRFEGDVGIVGGYGGGGGSGGGSVGFVL